MRIRKYISVLALGASMASSSFAEEPPKPPFVAEKAPEMSKWTVSFQYGNKEGARPTALTLVGQRIARLEVTKTGRIKLLLSSFSGGATQEIWAQGPLLVLRDPAFQQKIVRRNAQPGGDFPEFVWISASNFKGRETVDKKECLVFTGEFYPLQFADPALYVIVTADDPPQIDLGSKVPVTAYIDPVTRFPVKLVVGDDTRTYTFTDAPEQALVIPQDFQAALADVQQRYNALVKPLSPP